MNLFYLMDLGKIANYLFCPSPDTRDQYRVGVVIVAPSGKCLALLRSTNKKTAGSTWGVPGGKVDPLETLVMAAAREAYEETRLKVSNLKLIHSQEIDGKKYVIFAGSTEQECKPYLDHEHTDFKWVRPENWPHKIFPAMASILKDEQAVSTIKKAATSSSRSLPAQALA